MSLPCTVNYTILSNVAKIYNIDSKKFSNNRDLCRAVNEAELATKQAGGFLWRFVPQFEDLYSLEKEIARGGGGVVYKGVRIEDSLPVAIKVLHGIKEAKRLSEEIILMKKMLDEHGKCTSGVICYLDHFITANAENKIVYVIALEFLKGIDLYDLMMQIASPDAKVQMFDLYTFKKLLRNTLDSLSKLHAKNIAHRDIKPENIRIIEDDDVVLLDLGLSCSVDSEPFCKNTDKFVGTPCYSSSPAIYDKLWTDDAETISSDVFAVALSFWQMVFFEEPPMCLDLEEFTVEDVIDAHKEFKRPSLDVLKRRMRIPELAKIYYDLMAPTAAERPTAAQARDRIDAIIE